MSSSRNATRQRGGGERTRTCTFRRMEPSPSDGPGSSESTRDRYVDRKLTVAAIKRRGRHSGPATLSADKVALTATLRPEEFT